MSSATETQSSFDDFIQFPSTGHALAYPLVVKAQFPKKSLARAFRIDGGGDCVVVTGSGESRELTGMSDPYFLECKISEVTSATAATKIRLFV
jgi:hypothetical protein